MAEIVNDSDLDALAKPKADEDEFAEAVDEELDAIGTASSLLKRTAIMLEFISDPVFCKNITQRERKAIGRLLTEIYEATDELDEFVGELEE